MKSTPFVSIIILNYNGLTHTLNCLESLTQISFRNIEIILYDNGSAKDPTPFLRKRFPHVHCFHRKKNIGFCRGSNDAIHFAHGEYILLLNNDTIVTKHFLTFLVDRMLKSKRTGIAQPKLVFSKTKLLQSGCSFLTATGLLYHYGYGKNPHSPKYNRPMRTFSANGACMLVKREVIEKVGLFDRDFFLYFEETDFCHRAQIAGYDVWYEPRAVVYHLGGADNSKYKYASLMYHTFKNRIQSYLKNLDMVSVMRILPVHLLFCFGSVVIYFFTGRPESSVSVLSALWYNVGNIRRTLQKRYYVQHKLRKRRDDDFLPSLTKTPKFEYYQKLFTGLETYEDSL